MKNCNCFACQQQKEYENSIIGTHEVPIYKCINQKEMKTKTIEVKFPTIEGMKVENASVDLKNGLSIVEYVEDAKFKKGDIVYYSDSDGAWICIFDYETMSSSTQYIAMLNGFNVLHFNNYMDVICQRLATDYEKQLLFDALEKEGKYWDSESLEVKDIPKEEIIKNIFRELRGHNISVNEAYIRMLKLIPING